MAQETQRSMRCLFACLLFLAVWSATLLPQARAGLVADTGCAQICLDEIASMAKADMVSMVPDGDGVATFDGPASQARCDAAPRAKPVVHAIILAPFYEHFIKLPGTQEDAKLLTALFKDRGAPPEFIRSLMGKVDRKDIIDALEASLACVREKDQVVVTFSGGATTYRLWGAPSFAEFSARHCDKVDRESFCGDIADDVATEKEGGTTYPGEAYRQMIAEYDDLILFSSDVYITAARGFPNPLLTPDSRLVGLSAIELSNFMTQVRNRGGDVIVLLDTNYAAGARLLDRQNAAAFETSWRWSRESHESKPAGSKVVDLFGNGKMAALYATRSNEVAKESNMKGTILGELTFAVAEAMRSRGSPNIKQLAEDVDRTMKQRDVAQQPVFEASEPDLRLLTPRNEGLLHPDHIEILRPELKRSAAVLDSETREFELIARYRGSTKGAYAAIDGDNIPIDGNEQFGKTVDVSGRNDLYLRVYGEDHSLLAERRLKFSESEVEAAIGQEGVGYVLTIANQKYQDQGFPKLETPFADADALRDLLVRDFGYTDKLHIDGRERSLSLRNVTQRDITQVLFDIRKNITPEDRLVVYYAGHGEKDNETSYWVPVDGIAGGDNTWVNAFTIQDEIRKMNAGSVLLVSDSCYAGGLTRSAIAPPPPGPRDKYLAKVGVLKSRQFIGSGGIEPVLDGGGNGHSIFAAAMIEGLQAKAKGKEPFTASELFDTVKSSVLSYGSVAEDRQIPVFYRIERAGDEPASEFLFLPVK